MSFFDRLNDLVDKYNSLSEKLLQPDLSGEEIVKFSKEHSNLEPIVEKINEYKKSEKDLEGCEEMLKEELDSETKKMVEDEIGELRKNMPIVKR